MRLLPVLLLSFLIFSFFRCTNHPVPIQEYISNNHHIIDLEQRDSDFGNLFKDDLSQKEIFFSSEDHAVSKNKILELRLLEYFIANAGIKYLLIEDSYSGAALLNEYIITGDEDLLKNYMTGIKGALAYTRENYIYWQAVYALNKALQKEHKLHIVGVDVEHQPKAALRYLNSTMDRNELDSLPLFKGLLESYNTEWEDEVLRGTCEAVIAELNIQDPKVKNTGDKRAAAKIVLRNIINRIDAFREEEHYDIHRKRDQYIYENFIEQYATLPKGRYFGQWGLNHVFQAPQLEINWFASLLDKHESSPVKGKILSIATFYKNSRRNKWRSDEEEVLNSFYPPLDTLGMINLQPESFCLYKLNATHSPFQQNLLWFFANQPDSGVTTDYFDYMIIGNKLPAAQRYE